MTLSPPVTKHPPTITTEELLREFDEFASSLRGRLEKYEAAIVEVVDEGPDRYVTVRLLAGDGTICSQMMVMGWVGSEEEVEEKRWGKPRT